MAEDRLRAGSAAANTQGRWADFKELPGTVFMIKRFLVPFLIVIFCLVPMTAVQSAHSMAEFIPRGVVQVDIMQLTFSDVKLAIGRLVRSDRSLLHYEARRMNDQVVEEVSFIVYYDLPN